MHSLKKSNHFKVRTQQRCVNGLVTDVLFTYGESRKCRGGVESIFFSRESLIDIRNEFGASICNACEKLRNSYLIVSEDGVLITAARSNRRTIH